MVFSVPTCELLFTQVFCCCMNVGKLRRQCPRPTDPPPHACTRVCSSGEYTQTTARLGARKWKPLPFIYLSFGDPKVFSLAAA